MLIKPVKILSIDPGTKEVGVAVHSDGELLYYAIKTIRNRHSPGEVLRQVQRIITTLIADYEPQYLAIEKMFLIQKSASLLIVVADEIKALARAQGLTIYEYAPTAVRKLICKTGKATKRETAKKITALYPELRHYLERQTKWETLYYANLFDAVAVGVCCYREINKLIMTDSAVGKKFVL